MMEQSKEKLRKRARYKYLSSKLAAKLIEECPDSALKSSYENTLRCNRTLLQSGKQLTAKYCKNRWCPTCNRIRTAILINGYMPVLERFDDPWFLTLTKRTVPASRLTQSMVDMYEACRDINQSSEGRRRKIEWLRKHECTSRPNWLYHPHYHMVIDGESNAKWYYEQWLNRFKGEASNKGQDCKQADEKALKELFKYFTKLTVSQKDKDGKKLPSSLIEPDRMDVIFNAMKGKRVYQPSSNIRMVTEDIDRIAVQEYEFLEEKSQVWKWIDHDWFNDLGESLTGYTPSKKFDSVFNRLDKESEGLQLTLF